MTPPNDIRSLLEQAAAQLKQGNKKDAQGLLAQAVMQDPNNSSAWYGLAIAVDDIDKKRDCLKRVLVIKPDHDRALAMQARLETPPTELPSATLPAAPIPEKSPEQIRKQAGVSTREMERGRRSNAKKIALVGLGVVVLIATLILVFSKQMPVGVFIALFIAMGVLYKLIPYLVDKKLNESRRAGHGAQAEEKIGELLAELGSNFVVLHDVECAYGNIDHLVIASNGAVFMIETKSHRGKVTVQDGVLLVNGHKPEKDFIAQSLRNSFWLRDQIEPFAGKKPWVTAVLVFTNGFVQVHGPVKGVIVTNKKYLFGTIQKAVQRAQMLPGVWEKREEIVSLLG